MNTQKSNKYIGIHCKIIFIANISKKPPVTERLLLFLINAAKSLQGRGVFTSMQVH